MRYYLDTEFIEDGKTIQLISLALVAEDGRELYLVNKEINLLDVHAWLWENVMPYLPPFGTFNQVGGDAFSTPMWQTRDEIRRAVIGFIGVGPEGNNTFKDGLKPEFWGYYAATDFVAFYNLFGVLLDLPIGWPKHCFDLKQMAVERGNPALPAKPADAHDALADARWHKEVYDYLKAIPVRT